MKCVNCERELKSAPTERGHMDCGPHGKICFECLEDLHKIMVRVKERAPSPNSRIAEIADDLERAVCVINNGNKKERLMGMKILADIIRQLRNASR